MFESVAVIAEDQVTSYGLDGLSHSQHVLLAITVNPVTIDTLLLFPHAQTARAG
jgi:hypothetical protein